MKPILFILCLLVWAVPPLAAREKTNSFKPTQAQKQYPRVRAAREKRSADVQKLFQEAGIDYPVQEVLIRVFKKDDVLELWVRPRKKKKFVHLKDYAICSKSGVLGPKRRRGDLQVPEGFYQVTWFNPASNFLLSMKVNYPNASDRIRGYQKNLGGDIFIHGDCVTIGCVPLTDRWIEELYPICLDTHWRYGKRTLVHIFPTRMDEAGMKWLEENYAQRPNLLSFWKELQPGYTLFEQSHIPPRFSVGKNGEYRFYPQK